MKNHFDMRFTLMTAVMFFLLAGCKTTGSVSQKKNNRTIEKAVRIITCENKVALEQALSSARPGDEIILSNGIWKDVYLEVAVSGAKDSLITIRAETPGKVVLEGQSYVELGGDYIVVQGLYLTNGYSPSRSVIKFATKDKIANHCRVTNCAIKDYNKPQRNKPDLWVQFHGRHNQMDHCYLAGKSNRGPTVRVDLKGNENINNHHKIIHNHFGPRPPKGGPSAETIQIGDSHTSMCPSYTLIAHNLFDECNGEVEVISSKSNYNEFRNNVFWKSEGSLVTRHGNYCTIDGNYFIGDESSNNAGGVRLIGTGHTVTNNYFYNLHGSDFRAPVAVMNGIPKSPLNRYIQVTDVIIAYNSFINCTNPLQFGIGANLSQKDVLPISEIRSARPIRTVVANNLIFHSSERMQYILAFDELDGVIFKNNITNNQSKGIEQPEGIVSESFEMQKLAPYILGPSSDFQNKEIHNGYGFEKFDKDLFGASRKDHNSIGAIAAQSYNGHDIFNESQYGTDWSTKETETTPSRHKVSEGQSLAAAIANAEPGDIIELSAAEYSISDPIKISKSITIQSISDSVKTSIIYVGAAESPLFAMNPKGSLTLKNIQVNGDGSQYAFASLDKDMSSSYNLKLVNCSVENFSHILKTYKYSFAQFLHFEKTTFSNCKNGLELSEEIDNKGEYNAENITIDECIFENIKENVIDYYRGGYDESTVGGNLSITNSHFENSGGEENNGVLLNTYGIINVRISGNTFANNKVKHIAVLWGSKNNNQNNNSISNSGTFVTEENLKLKTFY